MAAGLTDASDAEVGDEVGDRRLVRATGTLSRRVAAGVLVLAPGATDAVLLSGSGAAVWELLVGTPMADVVQILAGAYDTEADVVAADIEPVIAELTARGLVTPTP